MNVANPREMAPALLAAIVLFLDVHPVTAAELDCAKLLVPTDVKTACGKVVTVAYAQAAPALGNGCSVMLKTSTGDSLRFELSNYSAGLARRMFESGNRDTEKGLVNVPGLGDAARQYHLTNVDAEVVKVLSGQRVIQLWAGKQKEAQVCSYAQMQQLARVILGRLPK